MSALWERFCKMTCLGGSERGECSCTCPADCELQDHPDYERQRELAIKTMWACTPIHPDDLPY